MPSVRVRVQAAEFFDAMRAMAEWLDANGYEATRYKYTHGQNAVLVTIDFSSAVAANAFAVWRRLSIISAGRIAERPVLVDDVEPSLSINVSHPRDPNSFDST
jgi:hypothetical protein